MSSLFAKLAIALVTIVVSMGAALYIVDHSFTRAYYEELSQKLNASIAMYVTDQRQLITDGVADLDSLRDLAGQAMVINPTAEIYLTDADGNILGHNLPEESVHLSRIDLAPVHTLISGEATFPLRGVDPRNATSEKVFSAAEVRSPGGLEGYLYVVLGGQQYEELASNISGSYVMRASASAAVAIVALTALLGFLVFRLLTKRLRRLSTEIERVTESRFIEAPELVPPAGGDEIDQLSRNFVDMATQIRQQIAQLRENDHLRRELVSSISHDLRTPLSAMQGSLETLIVKGESLNDEDRDRLLRMARKHTVRLGSLIGDLFELAKLDSASVTPSLEAFSLPELAQDIAQEFQVEAERRGIRITIETEPTTAFTLGDIGLIQRVLENLVRNAVQYTPDDGEIVISIAQHDDAVTVAVADNGPGIAEQDLPRIFDRFYRAKDSEEVRSDSSGLGLAIVKRILDLHGSRITVTSQLESGTEFQFDLPVCQEAA